MSSKSRDYFADNQGFSFYNCDLISLLCAIAIMNPSDCKGMRIPIWYETSILVMNCLNGKGFFAARTKIGPARMFKERATQGRLFGYVYEVTTISSEVAET